MSVAPGEQHDRAVGAEADLDLRGVGQRRVADAVPHGPDPDAAAERARRLLVVPRGVGAHRRPARPQRLEAGGQARARRQALGGRGEVDPPGARSGAGTPGGRCRAGRRGRPSAPRGRSRPAARRTRGMRRPGCRSCRSARLVLATARHRVRPGRVDRHPVGDGGAPRGVGARVEVGVDADRGEAAIRVGTERGGDAGRVALRRRGHRLRAGIERPDRRSRMSAAIAMSGCSDRSSLPPKPPPQALGMTRTRSTGRPRIRASSSRSMYGVWVVAKTSTRPSTMRAVPASGSM